MERGAAPGGDRCRRPRTSVPTTGAAGAALAVGVARLTAAQEATPAAETGTGPTKTVDPVQMKAYSAASFRRPAHQSAGNNAGNPARIASLPNIPRFTLLAGGFPIEDGDAVVGGIGIGGGGPDRDTEVAEAALAALGA